MASRWLDSVDRFLQDPQAATPILEGSMADGKDPKPDVLSQQPSQATRQRTGRQVPNQRPLPPVPSEHPTPTGSNDMSSSFSSSSYTYNTPGQQPHPGVQHAYLSPPDQHPQIPQNVAPAHPETYVGQPYAPQDPSLLQAHQQPPPQDSLWYPRPPQPSDGLDILINAAQQPHAIPPTYDIVNTSGLGFFNEELLPKTDGFDDQLQTFTGASPEIHQSNGWMNGFHGGPLG